ncbi:MAG: branched-chain amino acid ABC transporter permease [Spirochaetae bacterium HGW-Spirochaetae-3]|jgi:branched-chain amino acid transport system permease protein|nr:MAG: branched-chain amino acid ABC transporter permease [Spirochaetae bacterium HGW-Spirochaetae-3]
MKRNTMLSIAAGVVVIAAVTLADATLGRFTVRILNLSAIYIILALSLNLLNGFTGLFSLGHAGFMAVGAYVSALLTMSPAQKEMNFFLEPIVPILATLQIPFPLALIAAGTCAGLVAVVIGVPALRLRDDYLAIATLGFAEIIRVILTNTQNITNGAQGLKGITKYSTTWVVWSCAVLSIVFMLALVRSSYGRTMKAVRDDEIAAEAMGVNVVKVKSTSFVISSFMAGVGGALLGHMITTIDPKMFTLILTFNILLIVVLGGNGSITGSVVGAIIVTVLMEALRFLDMPMNFLFIKTDGLPGLRMVIFSILLMIVVLYRQKGLMGNKEFSWDGFIGLLSRKGSARNGGRP